MQQPTTHTTLQSPGLVGGNRDVLSSWGRGASLSTVLCCPGAGEKLGNIIHNQLKSTVYPMLASVHSLGQGELDQCPVCGWVQQVSSRSQFSHPPPLGFAYYPSPTQVLSSHYAGILCVASLPTSWPHVPSGSFHCGYR